LPGGPIDFEKPIHLTVLYPVFDWHDQSLTSRRHHGLARSAANVSSRLAASVSSRFVITACAAHVSATASRRFRISFSVFKISMVANRQAWREAVMRT
jgi:hypothetical protein